MSHLQDGNVDYRTYQSFVYMNVYVYGCVCENFDYSFSILNAGLK